MHFNCKSNPTENDLSSSYFAIVSKLNCKWELLFSCKYEIFVLSIKCSDKCHRQFISISQKTRFYLTFLLVLNKIKFFLHKNDRMFGRSILRTILSTLNGLSQIPIVKGAKRIFKEGEDNEVIIDNEILNLVILLPEGQKEQKISYYLLNIISVKLIEQFYLISMKIFELHVYMKCKHNSNIHVTVSALLLYSQIIYFGYQADLAFRC